MFSYLLPDLFLTSIYDIPIDVLIENKINTLIFDIDNTLVPYKTKIPSDKELSFIRGLIKQGFRVALLSNNSKKRVSAFNEPLNLFAIPRATKPLIYGIKKVMRQMGTCASNTAIIGDQIFTDVWCGKNAGVFTILVSPITTDESLSIKLKRKLEKKILRQCKKDNLSS